MKMTRLLAGLILGAIFFSTTAAAEAAQRTVVSSDGKVRIVHDELGPVLMHRIFPPYKGIHIHRSELSRLQSAPRR